MLYLSSSPFTYSDKRILHIGLNSLFSSGLSVNIKQRMTSNTQQDYKIGLTSITKERFNYFDSYILHPVEHNNLLSYRNKIKNNNILEWLKEAVANTNKTVIVIGTLLNIISKKVFILPKPSTGILSHFQMRNLDLTTPGLGFISHPVDYNFDPNSKSQYTELLYTTSTRMPIYLLDPTVVYSTDGEARFGRMYKLDNKNLVTLAEIPELRTEEIMDRFKARTIKPRTAIYSEEEKKKEEAVISVNPTKNK